MKDYYEEEDEEWDEEIKEMCNTCNQYKKGNKTPPQQYPILKLLLQILKFCNKHGTNPIN